MSTIRSLFFALIFFTAFQANAGWKAGTAKITITPPEDVWMAGFAYRENPGTGKLHDLWAKALVLQDEKGTKAIIITMDIVDIPVAFSARIRNTLKEKYGFEKSQIILNCSHTHSGPLVDNEYWDILYKITDEYAKKVKSYTKWLEDRVITVAGKAAASVQSANVFYNAGFTRFAVNRRKNATAILNRLTEIEGPSDYGVPVLKVTDKKGAAKAILFGYSCHNTALGIDKFNGDYAGFAQIEVEKGYPGAVGLFFAACGGDQDAMPRGGEPVAEQYGKTLAFAVKQAIEEGMDTLKPDLKLAYNEIPLKLSAPPTREDLQKVLTNEKTAFYEKNCALKLITGLDKGQKLSAEQMYPVQVWNIGGQPLISLGGEVVADYAINLKNLYGEKAIVMGYCNEVTAYIPTASMINESRNRGMDYDNGFNQTLNLGMFSYEGGIRSQMATGYASVWSTSIENAIIHEVIKLAESINIKTQ